MTILDQIEMFEHEMYDNSIYNSDLIEVSKYVTVRFIDGQFVGHECLEVGHQIILYVQGLGNTIYQRAELTQAALDGLPDDALRKLLTEIAMTTYRNAHETDLEIH